MKLFSRWNYLTEQFIELISQPYYRIGHIIKQFIRAYYITICGAYYIQLYSPLSHQQNYNIKEIKVIVYRTI